MCFRSYDKTIKIILALFVYGYQMGNTQELLSDASTSSAVVAPSFHVAITKAKSYGAVFPDSGLIWVEKAYQNALTSSDILQQIEALIYLSQFQFWNDRYDESLTTILKADSLFQKHPENSLALNLLYRKAECLEFTNHPKEGMATFEKCYGLAQNRSDTLMLNRLDIKFGNIHRVTKDFHIAANHFKKAINRTSPSNPIHEKAYYKAILEYHDMVIEENWNSDQDPNISSSSSCNELGSIIQAIKGKTHLQELKLSFLDLELHCILNGTISTVSDFPYPSIEELQSKSSNANKFQTRLDLYTALAIKEKNFKKAKAYSDVSWQLSHQSPNLVLKVRSADLRKEIFSASNDYQSVIQLMEFSDSYRSRLANDQRMQSIKDLENKLLETEIKWQDKTLENEKKLLAKQNFYFLLSSIGFGLLSLFALYFYYLSRKRNNVISEQNKSIAAQNQSLEELNKTKDHIFAVVAHDLRKPALAFRGISTKVNYLINKKEYETLNTLGAEIEQDARSLNQLTDNILNWALLQENTLPNNPQEVQLQDVSRVLQETFQGVMGQKNIQFQQEFSPDFSLFIDANAVQIILHNLLDNAIKYTPQNGIIKLSAEEQSGEKIIAVKDSGIGIPREKRDSLFDLTKGKNTAGTDGEKGTGLGLHLVKELVELNQGTVNVASQANQGTTFTIHFPAQ